MCAILDANVAGDVFGAKRTSPGRQFFDWLETPRARLVGGGKLYPTGESPNADRQRRRLLGRTDLCPNRG